MPQVRADAHRRFISLIGGGAPRGARPTAGSSQGATSGSSAAGGGGGANLSACARRLGVGGGATPFTLTGGATHGRPGSLSAPLPLSSVTPNRQGVNVSHVASSSQRTSTMPPRGNECQSACRRRPTSSTHAHGTATSHPPLRAQHAAREWSQTDSRGVPWPQRARVGLSHSAPVRGVDRLRW